MQRMGTTGRPRRSIATFDTYADAQRAVDRLSDAGFPVERVAIVGHDLRYVEQVAGRLTTGRAALLGGLQGSLLGGLLGLIVALVFSLDPNPTAPLLVLYGIVAGGLLGALLGALTHAAMGGERDFASVGGLQADRFEVLVDEDVAERAVEVLGIGSTTTAAGPTPGAGSTPAAP
jgi:hypothetical protein